MVIFAGNLQDESMALVNPYLQVDGLTKRIGERVLFEKVSFGIAEGQHVGLIAKNGTGKSTLLNILGGKDGYDEGSVVFRRDLKVGYLEQQPCYSAGQTVIEACFSHGNEVTDLLREYEKCMAAPDKPGLDAILDRMEREKAWDYETRAKQILSQLKIEAFNQEISTLSGGQLKRVALANVLITEPDLLILDEPTNHLDLEMIEWLEEYLKRSKLSLLMVTHDRYFLDRVCSVIMELDDRTIYTYKGNYSYYLQKRQERIDASNAEVARANNLYRKELDWMRRMPCARGHKARYREEAFYELEKVAKRKMTERQVTLEVKSSYIGSKIFEADYISKSYGPDKVILKDFFYNFSRYEKMGIVGNNGTGKSTFIKILLGLVKPDSGRIVVGETVRFGYYSQDGLDFDEQMKVIDVVRDIAEYIDLGGGRHLSAMQFLQHFMFSPKDQQNYVYKLSGGERRRLYLCTVLMRNPNFLVLDEPTNDLDIVTLQVLEEYLRSFKGCVIVVSHDRYFMDKVVDHLLVFRGQGDVRDFPGNYTQYRDWEEERLRAERERQKVSSRQAQTAPSQKRQRPEENGKKRKLTFKEKREMEMLEKEIEVLEAEKKQVEHWFRDYVCPVLSPMVVDGHHPFPHLPSKSLNIVLILRREEEKRLGIIPIPKSLPLFYQLPERGLRYLLTEQVVLAWADALFGSYQVEEKYVMSVTRNADISPEDEDYEEMEDFRTHMQKVLKKRARLAPVRLEIQGRPSPALVEHLCRQLNLPQEHVFCCKAPLAMGYVFALESKLPPESAGALCYPPFQPQWPAALHQGEKLIPQILKKDVLLFYPYHAMTPFLHLIREAANDPAVLAIKITIYRLASTAKLVEYLAAAAENGKDVTVLMELRARFDEQNNIAWVQRLEEAGCTVLYGFEHYKVHSKICLITRRDKGRIQYITQIGTGNYNEKTARMYTDLCLMTASQTLGRDAASFFQNMSVSNLHGTYQHLLVAPYDLKPGLLALMDGEIEQARAGKPCGIFIKVNSVTAGSPRNCVPVWMTCPKPPSSTPCRAE